MKTAYELAMERLSKTAPLKKISAKQKQGIVELEKKYAARIAEREISLSDEMEKAAGRGDFEAREKLQQELVAERRKLQDELEEKKKAIRESAG